MPKNILHFITEPSEWIAYGEVERVTTLEALNVIKARLTCFVGQMEGHTPVETDYQEIKIVTDAQACADSLFAEEIT